MRVGVDIGGTSIRASLFLPGDLVPAATEFGTSGSIGGDGLVERTTELVNRLPHMEDDQGIDGIGVAIPGIVDDSGWVSSALNLGVAGPYPLADRLSERLGVPIRCENDVSAAALGAFALLAGMPEDNGSTPHPSLAYLGIGTGFAVGLVLGGRIWTGSSRHAGEIGHLPAFGATIDQPCGCGRRGCLESVVAGPALERGWPGSESARRLFEAAAAEDPAALAVADPVIGQIVRALAWVVNLVDPALIVIGGGVGASTPALLDLTRRRIEADWPTTVGPGPHEAVRRLRQLEPDAQPGCLGAAMLADHPGSTDPITTNPNTTKQIPTSTSGGEND